MFLFVPEANVILSALYQGKTLVVPNKMTKKTGFTPDAAKIQGLKPTSFSSLVRHD
jgi:hypothetical protein